MYSVTVNPGGLATGDPLGISGLLLPCQIEIQSFAAPELATGNSPRSHVVLVFHFVDLERVGLVDPSTGDTLLRVGDRLVAICDRRTGEFIQAVRTPPGALPDRGAAGIRARRPAQALDRHVRRASPRASGRDLIIEMKKRTV